LAERLRPIIRIARPECGIRRADDHWLVTSAYGPPREARRLVVTCPTYAAAAMFLESDPPLAAALDTILYAPIVVVATGHKREDITHPLDGFCFLAPRNQGMSVLGSIWNSSIFGDRAPTGHVQFRTMLGGAGDPEALGLSDDELWQTIRREIGPLIGLNANPAFMRVYRWERGIPQYTLGHRERRQRIEELAARHGGLHFVGNAYYGVGLNDCVKMARRVADEIAA
ncbi:MAG: protoporphyrinogen oxidase, partial [candidate division Zixibacteria bacterium]|nr:protoporphyrinogen oxidase [candidate division Zixibacteria bacterium]